MTGQFPGSWTEPDDETLDWLVGVSALSADAAVIGVTFLTGAERTRAALREAVRFLLANRLVVPVPEEDRPAFLRSGPP